MYASRQIHLEEASLEVLRLVVITSAEKKPLDTLEIQRAGTKGFFKLTSGRVVYSGRYTIVNDGCDRSETHDLFIQLLENSGGQGRSRLLLADLVSEWTFTQYAYTRLVPACFKPEVYRYMSHPILNQRQEEEWKLLEVGVTEV